MPSIALRCHCSNIPRFRTSGGGEEEEEVGLGAEATGLLLERSGHIGPTTKGIVSSSKRERARERASERGAGHEQRYLNFLI